MKEVVLATRNKHKTREIRHILKKSGIKVVSLDSFPKAPEVIEDKKTIKENAIKKAVTLAKYTKEPTIADDSGLEVDFLKGAPGVYSARFAGKGCTYDDNNRKLLRLLKDAPKSKRKARFVCVIAVADKNGLVDVAEGVIKGIIADETKGRHGFGYDPVFYYPRFKKTFAELSPSVKNRISHRARALKKAKSIILLYFQKAL